MARSVWLKGTAMVPKFICVLLFAMYVLVRVLAAFC
jgi:hypothetical protein